MMVVGDPEPGRASPGLEWVRRRASGSYEVDPWGADPDWVDALSAVSRFGLRVSVTGDFLPTGPAVIVANRRFGFGEVLALILGVRRMSGRVLRPIGAPDIAPIGPLARRFGAIQAHPVEVGSLLRAGELLAMALTRQWRSTRVGTISPEMLEPVQRLRVPVIPAAVYGGEITGSWKVLFGPAILGRGRATPLAVAELADRARAGVQALLDDALPPTWWSR